MEGLLRKRSSNIKSAPMPAEGRGNTSGHRPFDLANSRRHSAGQILGPVDIRSMFPATRNP